MIRTAVPHIPLTTPSSLSRDPSGVPPQVIPEARVLVRMYPFPSHNTSTTHPWPFHWTSTVHNALTIWYGMRSQGWDLAMSRMRVVPQWLKEGIGGIFGNGDTPSQICFTDPHEVLLHPLTRGFPLPTIRSSSSLGYHAWRYFSGGPRSCSGDCRDVGSACSWIVMGTPAEWMAYKKARTQLEDGSKISVLLKKHVSAQESLEFAILWFQASQDNGCEIIATSVRVMSTYRRFEEACQPISIFLEISSCKPQILANWDMRR